MTRARWGSVSATATGVTVLPSANTIMIAAFGNSVSPLCTMASNTGCVSVGEQEMTLRISAVAVCSCSDSVSSRVRAWTSSNSRTFSIAITAWSEKVSSNSICFRLNGLRSRTYHGQGAEDYAFAQQRHADGGSDARRSRLIGALELRIGEDIRNMYGAPFGDRPAERRAAIRFRRVALEMLALLRREAVGRGYRISVAEAPPDDRLIRLAEPDRQFGQGIEYRLQIEGRAADDLEHVGGGGLLLQQFAQLVEQAHVLDGDDRLAGEIGEQPDLPVREGTNFLAIDRDDPDQLFVLEHRHSDRGPHAAELDRVTTAGLRSA